MRRLAIVATLIAVGALLLAGSPAPLMALDVGDKAPDFTLPATTQEKFSLSQFLGKKNVVLFGFIAAFSPT
jgi:cytochrome oxidase Cu insertion factor (SCO1/SenC/PrrC family)